VLYLDGDIIVRHSLKELWETDLQGNVLGMVQEPTIKKERKETLGMAPDGKYYNAGIILMDLDAWRQKDAGRRIVDFYKAHGCKLFANDQDAINGELQHENIKLVADVSAHNQGIDWDSLWHSGEIDGVIVRVSAGTDYVDSSFQENMIAITRLNIPYGFYIYSYAENYDEGKKYAEHVNKVAENYLSNATLGVYFDLESNVITKHLNTNDYDGIVKGFIDVIPQAKIYTYTDYSQNVLNSDYLLNLTKWIANYAVSDCPGNYQGWQYTSKGRVTGIPTNVDLSIFYY
jgi:GH25 family lysozyme M1 (1,4-beta-N-acetylmuramidase)